MKNMNKRILAAMLAAAMTLPAFACGEKIDRGDDSTSQSSDSAEVNSGGENGSGESGAENGGESKAENGNANNGGDESSDDGVIIGEYGEQNHKLVFEQPTVVDEEPVVSTKYAADGKIYIAKTDINGAAVTEAGGSEVTELYTGETNAASYTPGYTPSIKTYQAYWLDISKRKDFVFDGNLLEFEVKVKENTPDGVYPVEVYFADLSNYSANTDENAAKLSAVKFIPGYVCVNSDQPEQPKVGSDMMLTPETVSAKPGETVRMNVRVDNNPGIVAFVIRLHYDENAISIENAGAGSDLGGRATLTARTLDE